jgi:hypothetical protein
MTNGALGLAMVRPSEAPLLRRSICFPNRIQRI